MDLRNFRERAANSKESFVCAFGIHIALYKVCGGRSERREKRGRWRGNEPPASSAFMLTLSFPFFLAFFYLFLVLSFSTLRSEQKDHGADATLPRVLISHI